MSNFETIDSALLVTATGGAGEAPQSGGASQPRTWGQVGRDYAAACVQGATQSLASGGRPRNVKDAGVNAAIGCVVGLGNQAVQDLRRQ